MFKQKIIFYSLLLPAMFIYTIAPAIGGRIPLYYSLQVRQRSYSTEQQNINKIPLKINNLPLDFDRTSTFAKLPPSHSYGETGRRDKTTYRLTIKRNPFRFSGYYYEIESGNYYLNARCYSPFQKRFISRDTYDLANRYTYCNGNPFDNIDPAGHSAWSQISKTAMPYLSLGIGITAAFATAATTGGSTFAFLAMEIGNSISAGTNTVEDIVDHNNKMLIADSIMTVSGLIGGYSAQPSMFSLGSAGTDAINSLNEAGVVLENGKFSASLAEGGELTKEQESALSIINRGKKAQLISSMGSQGIQGAAIAMTNSDGSLKQELEFGGIGLVGGTLGGLAYGAISNILRTNKEITSLPLQLLDSGFKGLMRSGISNSLQEAAVVGTDFIAGGTKTHNLLQKITRGEAVGFASGLVSGVTQVTLTNYENAWSAKGLRMGYLFVKGPMLQKFMTGS